MTLSPPPGADGVRLTKAQVSMLRFYEHTGPTHQSDARGTMNTWRALLRRGLLSRSKGLGVIETEITEAGRAALSTPPKENDHE